MGDVILEWVVQLLQDNGIWAEAAQPAGNMVAVENTLSAVSLEQVDQAKETATIVVEVVSPAKQGAKICQIRALKVYDVLRNAGAVCRQDKCSFVSKADIFCVPVTAVFRGIVTQDDWRPHPGYTVRINGEELPRITGFSAVQETRTVIDTLPDAEWEFTLEELIPAGSTVAASLEGPFRLDLTSETVSETFTQCRWTSVRREYNHQGLRLTRSGISPHRQEATNG